MENIAAPPAVGAPLADRTRPLAQVRQIRRVEGRALCVDMLAGRSRGKCERYIDAIHLNEAADRAR